MTHAENATSGTSRSRGLARIRVANSHPFTRGNCKSNTIASGASDSTSRSNSSAPLAESTSNPLTCRYSANPSRVSSWSSTITQSGIFLPVCNSKTSRLSSSGAHDLRGRDDLTGVSLGMFAGVKEQAEYCCWQRRPPDGAHLLQCRRRRRPKLVQCRVDRLSEIFHQRGGIDTDGVAFGDQP